MGIDSNSGPAPAGSSSSSPLRSTVGLIQSCGEFSSGEADAAHLSDGHAQGTEAPCLAGQYEVTLEKVERQDALARLTPVPAQRSILIDSRPMAEPHEPVRHRPSRCSA